MRFRAFSLVVAACSVGACFSFGDLSGGSDDTDAGQGNDASGDASVATDTGSSDSDVSLDGATPFCLGQMDATFCADFDEIPDAMAGFTSLYANEGGLYALDSTLSRSLPSSFRSGNSALNIGTSAHAALVRRTGVVPKQSIQLDFQLQVDALDTQNTPVEALALVLESATRSSLQLNLKGTSSEVGEEIIGLDGGQSYYQHLFSKVLPTGKFVHVNILMHFDAGSRTTTVSVDDVVVVDHVPMNPAFVLGQVDLYLGNSYSPGPSDGSSLHYDNVSLTVE